MPAPTTTGLKLLNRFNNFRKLFANRKRTVALIILSATSLLFWFGLANPLFTEPYSTILQSQAGDLMGARIAADGQWRFPINPKLPEKFKSAIIQFEDKRFYSHIGVDPLALLRAIRLNLRHQRIISGGSTISMQVLRLARGNPSRSYFEKLIEAILAVRLEIGHSKNEILALYAAHAPFGGNVVGLESAAWRYFGRSPFQLSWAETCMLAVLPNAPALIHPGKNRTRLKAKRDRLIKKLHAKNIIDKTQMELALLEPLPGKPLRLPQLAPHLLETLIKKNGKQHRFITTVKPRLQQAVTKIVQRHSKQLKLQHIYNAAALVIDNETFNVLAYIGNNEFSNQSDFGYAIDIIQRPRSTGSILKPLLYANMLQHGDILPKTLIPDVPSKYNGFIPQNFDRRFRGAVPADVALIRSLNVPAVYMLKQFGIPRFYAFLKNAGMSTLYRHPDEYGLTLILGGAEGTLWDMTTMYSNLAWLAHQTTEQQRYYKTPRLLHNAKIETRQSAELDPAAAWLTLDALLDVNRPGDEGYWKNFHNKQKVAWKTGTSYGLRDAWAIGSSSRYTVGIWVGNAAGEGRPGLTGASVAAPVLFDIFNRLDKSSWISKPEYLLKQVKTCKEDGFLDNGRCETISQWIPQHSHFEKTSSHYQTIHLDNNSRWQVHSQCEPTEKMRHKNWFVLPPLQEHFYRKFNANYRILPPYRPDCQAILSAGKNRPIELLYPTPGTKIYIPIDLDRKHSKVVFEAVHRNHNATLYWHLDNDYIDQTNTFHQLALYIEPGNHTLTLVDEQGNRIQRRFKVLTKEKGKKHPVEINQPGVL